MNHTIIVLLLCIMIISSSSSSSSMITASVTKHIDYITTKSPRVGTG